MARTILASLLASLTLAASVGASSAETLVGLSGASTLVTFDTGSGRVRSTVTVRGSGRLVGIDVRPSDGTLYGLAADGRILTIDPRSGRMAVKSQLSQPVPTGTVTVDFNPVADRMRVIGADGTNLRVNVEDGKATVDGRIRYATADAAPGATPQVVAGAYTNSYKGATATALYDIDAASGSLVKQDPRNDGVVLRLGAVAIPQRGPVAFDISSDGAAGASGWLAAGGRLYRIDLTLGAATPAGSVPASLRDLSVLSAR